MYGDISNLFKNKTIKVNTQKNKLICEFPFLSSLVKITRCNMYTLCINYVIISGQLNSLY